MFVLCAAAFLVMVTDYCATLTCPPRLPTARSLYRKRAHFGIARPIWNFVYAKERALPYAKAAPDYAGDTWTFTALDADSKLIISYVVGPRDGETALAFMDDLRTRITERAQISTDGLKAYREAVDEAFGGDVDFAQIIKSYGKDGDDRKYSPASCTGLEKIVVWGSPNLDTANTSYVERQNLSMRMGVRRLTRLTNAFSFFRIPASFKILLAVWRDFIFLGTLTDMVPSVIISWFRGFCSSLDLNPTSLSML